MADSVAQSAQAACSGLEQSVNPEQIAEVDFVPLSVPAA